MKKPTPITIHDEGKIDIHRKKLHLQKALDCLVNNKNINKVNKELILDFIRDCMLGKTIIGKSKKKIGSATCLKYLFVFKILCQAFSKSFHDITQSDMEVLIQNIETDKIRTKQGQPYSDSTKIGIKKTIKKFWKWKDGNNKKYPKLVEWIDTYLEVKDVPALKRDEVEKMIEHTSNPRDKALLMVLFDSGARIEELLNVRLKKEHLFWKENLNCYMIRLEYSKTKPRTISVPLSTRHINNWLQIHPGKDNPQAQLFPMNYGNLRMLIRRIGFRVLDKRVTPHMLRHSSATFYANKLKNPYKLCYRYGWTMASKEVNRYLDREGILEEETPSMVKTDELISINKKNRDLEEELSIVKESNAELTVKFNEFKEELDTIRSGKGIVSILMNLTKQQKKMSEVLQRISGGKFDIVIPD